MMSAKTEKQYIGKKAPFGNYFNPYEQYRMKLDNNAYMIKNKFPTQTLEKIKQLLEELENNVEMAVQILEEQCGKSEVLIPEQAPKPKITETEQNKILKNAIARLYKKLMVIEKDLENTKCSNQVLKKDNQALRMQNTLLMNKEFCNNNIDHNSDVY